MKIFNRLHEWAADRFSFIQYPNVRGPKLQFFKCQMPLATRLFIAVMSMLTISISLAALAGLLMALYFVMS
ncbi:MAG: hypothetical protein A3I66_01440 [Burkholderiales bacterium RIFCSPLOWO2_02_FULL_57_36]|nr:MAG: hypothetical protein A3I66_01440 [Burkholderiales bacterium RIFCSPLOWO2_02_FULL_57_36]